MAVRFISVNLLHFQIQVCYVILHVCEAKSKQTNECSWWFPKIMVPPKSSIFNRGFPLFSPSILGYPYFWKPPVHPKRCVFSWIWPWFFRPLKRTWSFEFFVFRRQNVVRMELCPNQSGQVQGGKPLTKSPVVGYGWLRTKLKVLWMVNRNFGQALVFHW